MSSGSLKQFLKKTKKNHKTMNVKVSILTLATYCAVFCLSCGGGAEYCSPTATQIHNSNKMAGYVTPWWLSLPRHASILSW